MIVIFRPQAVEDVIEAAAWYEAHAPGLGEQLIDEILTATRRAQENPELFRIVRREANLRRVLTRRFPYRIFFSVLGETFTQFFTEHAMIVGGRSDCDGF